jgi:hypothetical protein
MAEAVATKTAGRAPSALSALRESRGGVSPVMKAWLKDQQDVRKRLRATLARGPRTVPEAAADAGLTPALTLWHLMAMRRYGEVTEAGERDRFVVYGLKKG